MKKKLIILLIVFYCQLSLPGFSQDLWNLVDSAQVLKKEFAYATFKTTRLVNLHTAEVLGKRTLDFRISHRFGAINSGSINAWGLDGPANIRIGLEYSFNGRWMFGIGRSSFEKMDDGFIKYKILRQTTGRGMPISLAFLTSVYYTAQKDANRERNGFDQYRYLSNRFSYVNELLFARKFNNNFSLQLGGWLVHNNLVDHPREKNDAYGASLATRLKFTKRMALAFEYAWRANKNYSESKFYDSMGIGLEIETGGHVFQVHVTNSFGIADNQFLTKTNSKWNNAGIRIGFNISRVFTL